MTGERGGNVMGSNTLPEVHSIDRSTDAEDQSELESSG